MIGLVGGSTTLARCGRQCCLAAQGPRHLTKQQQQQQQRQARPRQRPCRSVNDVAATAVAAEGAAGAEQPPSADDSLADETLDYVQHCQETYGCPGLIDFSEGHNGLPKATLQHPAGPSCEVYLHGAAVTSWRHADGREMLHLRESNTFDGSNPITGGIQIAWPQYGVGALPTHGFLQHLHWSVVDSSWRERGEEEEEDEDEEDELQQYDLDSQDDQLQADQSADSYIDWRPQLSLYASTDSDWEQKWPHKFEALYSITLQQPDPDEQSDVDVAREAAEQFQPWMKRRREEERRDAEAAAAAASASAAAATSAAKQPAANAAAAAMAAAADDPDPQPATPSVLSCLLQIHNCDETPFTFTTGLRTHLVTRDIPSHPKFVKVLGLRGKFILDYTRSALKPGLTVLDEHYVTFGDMVSQNRLFVDCDDEGEVLFCPGNPAHFNIGNAEGFKDIAIVHPAGIVPREARRFVEIDSARAVRKVTLQPGETWVGEMVLSAHDRYWDLPAWEAEDTSLVPLPDQTAELLQPNRTGGELTSEQLGAI